MIDNAKKSNSNIENNNFEHRSCLARRPQIVEWED